MTSRAAARQRGGGWPHGRDRAGETCADEKGRYLLHRLVSLSCHGDVVGCVAAEWLSQFFYWSSAGIAKRIVIIKVWRCGG